MSAATKATALPPNMTADGTLPERPSDVLIDLAADLLAPMFLAAARGNYRYARAAALETVWSFKAATQADLLQVIQIVAYGLAAVRTLCISMTEDVSVSTLLRLNLSAERLSRAEARARKARQADRFPATVSKTNDRPPRPRPPETSSTAASEPEPSTASVVPTPQAQPTNPLPETAIDETSASSAATVRDLAAPIETAKFQRASQSVEIRRYGSMRSWAAGTVSRDALRVEAVPGSSVRYRNTRR